MPPSFGRVKFESSIIGERVRASDEAWKSQLILSINSVSDISSDFIFVSSVRIIVFFKRSFPPTLNVRAKLRWKIRGKFIGLLK
jgi:hypothetical protein